ncbi:hypothetical protein BGZ80_009358 [Entomortierella chlamydospora]|uniref:Uncharacterized protein n=1 Tax=Entomortierella chlamydospora TaxID=101097 RepID=A0A9P6MXH5_9FUNG|nr:hypothetical protein BGZ79_004622 [Entomortierella chlamydospora]KAG0016220.1 hypothetical protein BGZ80_009358 [Entomortierella chlamydospora]
MPNSNDAKAYHFPILVAPASAPTPSSRTSQSQYHHYIPRFILKNFSDGSHGMEGDPQIKIHDVRSQRSSQMNIGKVYGVQNMYRDLKSDDCMQFEKLLGKLDSSAEKFVNKILSGSRDLPLTRAGLLEFKKFLAIMMYRSECRRKQYTEDLFDMPTRLSILRHMRLNNIGSMQEVWFENLKWIIKTSMDDINKEVPKLNLMSGPLAALAYNGPIHIAEFMDFISLTMHYVCIWQAPKGSEFILTDNCFGCYEGPVGITLHIFFVISPEYVVVMAHRAFMTGSGPLSGFLEGSWFKDFHASPDCVHAKKNVRSLDDFTPEDVFKYRRIVIPKEKVWLVNSIFLDARHKFISHKSDAALYRSLVLYEKDEEKLFKNKHDYSVLKRKLFVEMNRTHSA